MTDKGRRLCDCPELCGCYAEGYATTLYEGHGRIERRECWSISNPACLECLSAAGD